MFEDEDLIKSLVLKNAERKSPKEQAILAENYLLGRGIEKDTYMAFKLFEMSAKKFDLAKLNLALMYLTGIGVTQNVNKAIEIYKELAKQKNFEAIDRLAWIYSNDLYVEKNLELSFKLYNESARLGSGSAYFHLAKFYQEGIIVQQDYSQAKKYYEIALKKGFIEASTNIGYMYEQGLGVEKDTDLAVRYYKKAAEKGHIVAIHNLGCAYFDGKFIERDLEKAFDYLSQGVKEGYAPSKYSLGYMYYKGKGVEQDKQKAKELFLESAKDNDPQANYMLGYMYNIGECVERDYEKSFKYYKKAAQLGELEAIGDIGVMYMQGRGVEKDLKKAIEYFEEGIKLSCNNAKCNLAIAYVNGSGVERDIEKAKSILQTVDDEFISKFYYLGVIKHGNLTDEDINKDNINGAIGYFNKYLENVHNAEDIRYLPVVYFKLAECYLDLYYFDEANTNNRNKAHYMKTNINRDKAKEYLRLSKECEINFEEENKKILENDIHIAEDLLNDVGVNFSEMSYQQFKDKYFAKYQNIFLLTEKKEFEIYDYGVKYYFEKREDEKEIEKKIALVKENFEERKPLIRKRLEELKVVNVEEKLEEMQLKEIEKSKTKTETDFSHCVSNIDKYLEEILHYLFVDCLYEYRLQNFKQSIQDKRKEVTSDLNSVSVEFLKTLNSIIHNIDTSIDLKREILIKKIDIFTDKFTRNWNWKNIAEDKIQELKDYQETNKDTINEEENKLISNILLVAEIRKECDKMEKSDKFELGSLFYMAFVETETIAGLVPQKVVDPDIVKFVMSINENMSQGEATLKLNELLVKVEMFRVIVRNVASHKNFLNKASVEHGINISIVQENSIFKLLNELFGDYINQKYLDALTNDLQR